MAINVNEVYQTVLLILNKEQRGYITPDEFNKISTQVQLEIFEKYFEDLNQQLRVPQDETEYADRVKNIDDKISIFKTTGDCVYTSDYFVPPANMHRIGTVMYKKGADIIEAERVQQNELIYQRLSTFTKPSRNFPIYSYEDNGIVPSQAKIYVEPSSIQENISLTYVRKPQDPRWGYSFGSLGQYVYDPQPYIGSAISKDFSFLDQNDPSIDPNFGSPVGFNGATFPSLNLNSAGVIYSGAGQNLSFSMTLNATGEITDFTVLNGGQFFQAGDTIRLEASVFQSSALSPSAQDAIVNITAGSLMSGGTSGSTQFEIDSVDRTELILNILRYCGIVIRDPSIIQVATQMAAQEDQNEKQ